MISSKLVAQLSRSAPDDGDRSLAPIRAMIPDGCFERSTIRSVAGIVVDVGIYALALTGLALTDRWWLVLPLLALAGLAVSGLFVLGHDAAHGALFASRRVNTTVARLLFLPSLHVQEAWVLGHNRVHHGFTTRQGMDFVWHPLTPEQYRSLGPLARLRHRIEWSALGSGAYYLREVWWNKMMRFDPPPRYARAIRRDWWLVVGWAVVSIGGSGALGWWLGGGPAGATRMALELVIAPFLIFVGVIGWTVYLHHVGPEITWWTAQDWTRRRAQTESTTILRAPRLLNVFLHNIFIHVPHHVDARIPWYRLPQAAEAITASLGDTVVDTPLRFRHYVRATRRCKLYDFDAGRWLGYRSAPALVGPGSARGRP